MSATVIDIEGSLIQLLQGPRFPDREFVRGGATFGEVYRLAAGLRSAFGRPEQKGSAVCLATDDKAMVAAALLAALAGGPELVLPYAFSAQVFCRLQQLSGFTMAIADAAGELPAGTTVVRPRMGDPAELAARAPSPDAELLRIFTGGTSGAPQLWSKTGRNIFGEGLFLARYFGVTESDCLLATVPAYHIYGLLFSVLLPLAASATVIQDTPSFPGEILEAVQKHRPTLFASIPAHYRALRGRNLPDASLRLAFSSAGMLEAADNEAFYQANRVGVVEVYGSTETGGIATRNRSLGEARFTPFPVVSWKIKDERLCVRSPFLSAGLPRTAAGFFTCGDRAEAADGHGFTLLGRADGVAKVGGKRVDLEEVRAIIKKAPGVSDCVVLALPDPGGRESRLAALLQGAAVDLALLKTRLAARLEPYALPRLMKTVGRIPVKENGKYDREAIMRLLES